jgi:GntR family transcriptional regulator
MLLSLTDLSDEPLQGQIARQIRAKILNGELVAGDTLPSIRGLARDYHVSVVTVQRGYESLEREELIHSRRGKGFFVSDINQANKKRMALKSFKEKIKPMIKVAIDEGLSSGDILESIHNILNREE